MFDTNRPGRRHTIPRVALTPTLKEKGKARPWNTQKVPDTSAPLIPAVKRAIRIRHYKRSWQIFILPFAIIVNYYFQG